MEVTAQARFTEHQADELLREVRGDVQTTSAVAEKALSALAKALRKLPPRVVTAQEAGLLVSALGLTSEKALRFAPPENLQIIGSAALGCVSSSGSVIDISITLPRSCLDEKDQLDDRYTFRRAAWLSLLAEALRKRKKHFSAVSWHFVREDVRRPILTAVYSSEQHGITLHLIPCISASSFSAAKLSPSRGNLRQNQQANSSSAAASPHYNNSILWDMYPQEDMQSLQQLLQQLPALRDAILLLKVWAKQQGLLQAGDGLHGWLLTSFLGRVAASGALTLGMTALQMLRATLLRLSIPSRFLGDKSLAIPQVEPAAAGNSSAFTAEAFAKAFDTVFLDSSGRVNLAANVSEATAKQLQQAAKRGVALLNDTQAPEASFDAALLPRTRPEAAFDYWWHVSVTDAKQPQVLTSDLPLWRQLEQKVHEVARQALGNRATLVHIFARPLKLTESLSAANPNAAFNKDLHVQPDSTSILVAAQVDPEHATSLVDIGPDPNSPAATGFRAFWGDKAELRRFQDGRIAEAVAWQLPPAQRHAVLDHVMQYAMGKHLRQYTEDGKVDVHGSSELLDAALTSRLSSLELQAASTRQLQEALGVLAKQLRSLSLALAITAVQPISASVRRTAVLPQGPHPLAGTAADESAAEATQQRRHMPRCLEPVEVMVQLEGSGRWPKHAEAYRRTKAALGLQLAEELAGSFGTRCAASQDFVNAFAGGFAFRLHLHSTRDEAIVREQEAAQKLLSPSDGGPAPAPAAGSYAELTRQLKHHALVAAAVDQHAALASTIRVLARWLGAQLLSNHVCQEAAELLAVAAFSCPSSLPVPGSTLAGFMRVLQLLSQHPWRLRPLLIDPAHELTDAQAASLHTAFDQARADGRAPAMALCTPHDPSSSHWTPRSHPPAPVISRLAALAQRSFTALQEHLFLGKGDGKSVIQAVFSAPLVDFDLLINLHAEAVPGSGHALFPQPHAASRQLPKGRKRGRSDAQLQEADLSQRARAVLTHLPAGVIAKHGPARAARQLLIGFRPVQRLVGMLEGRFGGSVGTVCADYTGSCLVAVRWHPQAFEATAFDPSLAHCTLPVLSTKPSKAVKKKARKAPHSGEASQEAAMQVWSGQVKLDLQLVMADMAAMGAGMIESISPLEQ